MICKVRPDPSLSESVPESSRPAVLHSAMTETAADAVAVVRPIIPCAIWNACEMTIVPAKAPQVKVRSIR